MGIKLYQATDQYNATDSQYPGDPFPQRDILDGLREIWGVSFFKTHIFTPESTFFACYPLKSYAAADFVVLDAILNDFALEKALQ